MSQGAQSLNPVIANVPTPSVPSHQAAPVRTMMPQGAPILADANCLHVDSEPQQGVPEAQQNGSDAQQDAPVRRLSKHLSPELFLLWT